MRHAILIAVALVAILSLSGCGACLLVQRQECELHLEGGGSIPVYVHRRLHGILESEGFEPELMAPYLLSFVVFDPLDTAFAPLVGAYCMFDPDLAVEGGPVGVVAALTPFASLSPGMIFAPRAIEGVDQEQVDRLRVATGAEREQLLLSIFKDRNVRDLTFR